MICYNYEHRQFCREDNVSLDFCYQHTGTDGSLFQIEKVKDYVCTALYYQYVQVDKVSELLVSKNDRIGMLIPLCSLDSKVEILDKKSVLFHWFFFVASSFYCLNKEQFQEDVNRNQIVLIIVEKTHLSELKLEMEELEMALVANNVYRKAKKNELIGQLSKKINLKRCSPYLKFNRFIKKFYISDIYTDNAITRFYLFYQIIELLMDDVLVASLHENLLQCKSGNLSLRKNIPDSTELLRLSKILELTSTASQHEMHAECLKFVEQMGKDCAYVNSFPDSLYQVRNALVHRYRYYNEAEMGPSLQLINDYFEDMLVNILCKYKASATISIDELYDFMDYLHESANGIVV